MYRFVVIELWNQAILPYNLPLTVVVGLFALYWIICILGIVGVETFDIDLDTDVDLDTGSASESNLPSFLESSLRFINAADVPLFAVLSILSTCMWVISIFANYYLNPDQGDLIGIGIFTGSFIISVILVKIITTPLVPLFKKIKEHEKPEPAVGGTAIVTSKEVDNKYGQCEQKRSAGAPATLTCITSQETPIPRGTEVLVISYDNDKGTYLVKPI